MTYERGDKVLWWSAQSPHNRQKAIFLRYDTFYPQEQSAILVIRLGIDGKQQFRWPLRLMKPLIE